jgi:hypothetical protein
MVSYIFSPLTHLKDLVLKEAQVNLSFYLHSGASSCGRCRRQFSFEAMILPPGYGRPCMSQYCDTLTVANT